MQELYHVIDTDLYIYLYKYIYFETCCVLNYIFVQTDISDNRRKETCMRRWKKLNKQIIY